MVVVSVNLAKQTQTSLSVNLDYPGSYDIPYFCGRKVVYLVIEKLMAVKVSAFSILSDQFQLLLLHLTHEVNCLFRHRLPTFKG